MTEAGLVRLLLKRQRLRLDRDRLNARIAGIDARISNEMPEALGRNHRLSPRQKEVLAMVLEYRANKEIAAELHISVRTVKFHVSTLLALFKVSSRRELGRFVGQGA